MAKSNLRSFEGLRDMLFNELEGVQNGSVPLQRAKATLSISNGIMASVRTQAALDAQAQRTTGKKTMPLSRAWKIA